jgi:hypothetical protein
MSIILISVFGNASAFAKVRLKSKGIKWMLFHMLFDVLDISISKTIQKHLKTSELMLFQPKYTLKALSNTMQTNYQTPS